MKPRMCVTGAALAAIFLLPTASAQTSPPLRAYTFVGVINTQYNWYDGIFRAHALDYEYVQSQNYMTPVVASAEVSGMAYTGLDSLGTTQTMTQTGHGVARAAFPFGGWPSLRVYADGRVNNTFYNPGNPPYFDASNEEFVIDPDGVPDELNTYAHASFTEILQWGGTATNYKAYYRFHIKGHVAPGSRGHVHLYVESHGLSDTWNLPFNAEGLIDEFWVTNKFPAGLGFPQPFTANLIAQFVAQTQQTPEGTDTWGTFDFGAIATPVPLPRAVDAVTGTPEFDATITLEAIYVADDDGNPVQGWTLETASGTTYELIDGAPDGPVTEDVFENGFEAMPDTSAPAKAGAVTEACIAVIQAIGDAGPSQRLARFPAARCLPATAAD